MGLEGGLGEEERRVRGDCSVHMVASSAFIVASKYIRVLLSFRVIQH